MDSLLQGKGSKNWYEGLCKVTLEIDVDKLLLQKQIYLYG